MSNYPKRSNGDEYYPRRLKRYLKDENGHEYYARDRLGNELYPTGGKLLGQFVWRNGRKRYARDKDGNEIYFVRKRKSVVISDKDRPVPAKTSSGCEKYPTDGRGNQYYLVQNGTPVMMKDELGNAYFAKSRSDRLLIPWNHEPPTDRQWRIRRDANANRVYSIAPDGEDSCSSGVLKCLCELVWMLPIIAGLVAILATW